MRTIIGYQDGKAIWSENVPAENVGWGHSLGGRAIEPADTLTEKQRAYLAQQRYREKKLRGAALFDPETGAWKK